MEISLGELQDGVRRASAEVVKVLRTDPDVQALTPGGPWPVTQYRTRGCAGAMQNGITFLCDALTVEFT